MGSINKTSLLRRKKGKGKPKDLYEDHLKYCKESNYDTVKELLDEGADIHVKKKDGVTGLPLACQSFNNGVAAP